MPVAINYGTGFSSAWSNVATFVPKFVVFLIILVVGWLIAKVITKVLSAVLTRVGFDRAVERGGIKKALESSKYDASGILAKIVYYALMLFVLSTAFGVFGTNPVSSYLHAVVAYLPLVFVAIVIVIIASAIAAAANPDLSPGLMAGAERRRAPACGRDFSAGV
jgi:Conserved TM helix